MKPWRKTEKSLIKSCINKLRAAPKLWLTHKKKKRLIWNRSWGTLAQTAIGTFIPLFIFGLFCFISEDNVGIPQWGLLGFCGVISLNFYYEESIENARAPFLFLPISTSDWLKEFHRKAIFASIFPLSVLLIILTWLLHSYEGGSLGIAFLISAVTVFSLTSCAFLISRWEFMLPNGFIDLKFPASYGLMILLPILCNELSGKYVPTFLIHPGNWLPTTWPWEAYAQWNDGKSLAATFWLALISVPIFLLAVFKTKTTSTIVAKVDDIFGSKGYNGLPNEETFFDDRMPEDLTNTEPSPQSQMTESLKDSITFPETGQWAGHFPDSLVWKLIPKRHKPLLAYLLPTDSFLCSYGFFGIILILVGFTYPVIGKPGGGLPYLFFGLFFCLLIPGKGLGNLFHPEPVGHRYFLWLGLYPLGKHFREIFISVYCLRFLLIVPFVVSAALIGLWLNQVPLHKFTNFSLIALHLMVAIELPFRTMADKITSLNTEVTWWKALLFLLGVFGLIVLNIFSVYLACYLSYPLGIFIPFAILGIHYQIFSIYSRVNAVDQIFPFGHPEVRNM